MRIKADGQPVDNNRGIGDRNETLLNALEKKLVFLVVNRPAITKHELARDLDIDPRTVVKMLKHESVKIAIAEFQKNCDQILFDSLTKAAQVVRAALSSSDEKIKTKVAVDLLKGLGKFRNYNDSTYVD